MPNDKGRISNDLPGASAGDNFKDFSTMLDGSQFTASWLHKMQLEGNCYGIHAGTASTPITGNGVYVATTPDLDVLVPVGKVFIPTYLKIVYETVGTSGIQEVLAIAGLNGATGAFATTGTAATIVNKRLDLGNNSGLSARQAATVAVLPVGSVDEFFRESPPMGITKSSESATVTSIDPFAFEWSILKQGNPPICWSKASNAGQCRINVWMGGQAPTGFIKLEGVLLNAN